MLSNLLIPLLILIICIPIGIMSGKAGIEQIERYKEVIRKNGMEWANSYYIINQTRMIEQDKANFKRAMNEVMREFAHT